jgi:hypothetical protein
MSEHEQRPAEDEQLERDDTIEDLDVPEEQRDDVAGGVRKAGDKQLEY